MLPVHCIHMAWSAAQTLPEVASIMPATTSSWAEFDMDGAFKRKLPGWDGDGSMQTTPGPLKSGSSPGRGGP